MTSGRFALHTWELSKLVAPCSLPPDYALRRGRGDELGDMLGVIAASLGSEPEWARDIGTLVGRLDRRMRETLGASDCDYLVATARDELVAVSGLAKNHVNGQNFLTGVCVHPRHQRRGVGTGMLSHSLHRLHEMGATVARVYTDEGSIADRFLYPRFDSVRVSGARCPSVSQDASRLMRGWLRFG